MSKIDLSSINKKYNSPKVDISKNAPKKNEKGGKKQDNSGIIIPTKQIKTETNRKKLKQTDIIPTLNKHVEVKTDTLSTKRQVGEKSEILAPTKLTELERSKKIKLLELYIIEFPEELEKYKNKNFNKCSDSELIDIKNQFDKQVCSKNNLHWGVSVSQQILQVYEMLCIISGLEVEGISKLGYNEEWIKNVKAICLKYLDGGITMVEPEHQLLFMLIQNTFTLHYLNSSNKNEKPKTIMKENINEINNKFEDL